MKTILISAFLFTGFFSLTVLADPPQDLPRFFEVVTDQVYRGAQPTENGYKQLATMGIKTVIDLRGDDSVKDETKWAQANGIKFINVPLSGFFEPSDANMNEIETDLNDVTLRPLFIHCQQVEDRTGLSIGLYRVFSQGWTPAAAWAEMEKLGFHSILLGLTDYFKDKTGYDP